MIKWEYLTISLNSNYAIRNRDEKLRELVNDRGAENIYIEKPELNLDTVVIDNKKIHKVIDDFNNTQISTSSDTNLFTSDFVF